MTTAAITPTFPAAMTMALKTQFTAEEFYQALGDLDNEILESKNLKEVLPIKLICGGGFVAISHLRLRETTDDINFILDPQVKGQTKIRAKLRRAIENVAAYRGLTREWLNSRMEVFAVGNTKMHLFRDSLDQNVILWQGKNLVLYAVKWEWSLARKLKRIGSSNRSIDLDDAVAILRKMVDEKGGPLQRSTVKDLDQIVYTPIEDSVLDRVALAYNLTYGTPGIV
ncbi:MAG: hypothetical protein M1819_007266 [Sarea resinae]|nr:MAG: hypothetical protein M1819_007266 [Sarea resinae]